MRRAEGAATYQAEVGGVAYERTDAARGKGERGLFQEGKIRVALIFLQLICGGQRARGVPVRVK